MGLIELAVIAALVAVFFGIGKLPEAMGTMGRTVKAFKDGLDDPEREPEEPPED